MSEWVSTEDEWPADFSDVWVSDGRRAYLANVKNVLGGLSCAIMGNATAVVIPATHWKPINVPELPKPTAREALREAIMKLEEILYYLDEGRQVDRSYGLTLLPRLRAALESE